METRLNTLNTSITTPTHRLRYHTRWVALRSCSVFSAGGIPPVNEEAMLAQRHDVDDGITDATLALLRAKGPRAVTVEAGAARSGIAKTTIYRRHRHRRDMLSAALSRMTTPEPLAAQVEAPDRLRWLIREAVKTIEVGIGLGGFAALLTDDDPDFTKLFRRILADKRAGLDSVI